jgi:hypothetical protein
MLLINVLVEDVRGVSIMYASTVGKLDARLSSKMLPEALHTKTSICPGVSTRMFLIGFALWLAEVGSGFVRASKMASIWSIFVAKRFKDVRIPPLGPRLYLVKTLVLLRIREYYIDEDVLLHDLLIVDRVADVNIAIKRHTAYCWIEVDDIWGLLFAMEVRVDPLHKCRLPRAWRGDVSINSRSSRNSILAYRPFQRRR